MDDSPLSAALDVIVAHASSDNWAATALAHGLMIGYDARWREAQRGVTLDHVELPLEAELRNPESTARSRTWRVAGVLDKLTREGDEIVLFDHKTTSSDISDPSGPYWRQLAVASQATLYELLLHQHGIRVDKIIWDAIRKPTIKPKQIPAAELARMRDHHEYCGFAITGETVEIAMATKREGPELFSLRVAAECLDKPDNYFARRGVPRTSDQLLEYATELWHIGEQMRDDRRRKVHVRNTSACYSYGTPCEFLSLCAGSDLADSDNWQARQKPDDKKAGGKNVLSHSRMTTWQTCRRKHYYRYELSIERVGAQRSDALDFGSLMHRAMDAWWLACEEERRNGDSYEQPARRADSRQAEAELAGRDFNGGEGEADGGCDLRAAGNREDEHRGSDALAGVPD